MDKLTEKKNFTFATIFVVGLLITAYLSGKYWDRDVLLLCVGAAIGVAVSLAWRKYKENKLAKGAAPSN
ncbi:MAG: hypothetical protein E6Q76_05620 [Rhizobium sp.]|nr:MAG: hypothetical protein E6Q76_05620 [Rhizobium sp.]